MPKFFPHGSSVVGFVRGQGSEWSSEDWTRLASPVGGQV